MKISYIITPFENSKYLVRCINSLYRQIGSDFEVILAENDFAFAGENDELNRFLDEKKQVIRISVQAGSKAEKLTEAAKLVSDDSDYVMLVDVNTVVAPIAAQLILNSEKSDLIILAAAVRSGDEFKYDSADETSLIKNIGKYYPYRICFGRKIFTEHITDFMQEQKNYYWILAKFFENPVINFTKDVCIYMENFPEEKEDEAEAEHLNIAMARTADNFESIENVKIKYDIVDKFIGIFLNIFNKDPECAAPAFTEFQNFCGRCKDSPLLNRLVEQKVGCKPEEFLCFGLEEYEIYRHLSHKNESSFFAVADSSMSNKVLSEIQIMLKELKKDVVAIKTEQKMLQVTSSGSAFTDPVNDIPRMYREGRLGFKIILRSFKCWLSYKLSKEK